MMRVVAMSVCQKYQNRKLKDINGLYHTDPTTMTASTCKALDLISRELDSDLLLSRSRQR